MVALPGPETLLYSALVISVVLIAIIVFRPSLTATRGGKIFAFLALFILPILCTFGAASDHIERSKQTTFCLSCHIMEPYGKSLYVDDRSYIPAAHFQNHRIPVDEACYTCHTDYALYGGVPRQAARIAPHLHPVSRYAHRRPTRSNSIRRTTTASACIAIWAHARSKATPFTWPSWIRSKAMQCPA